jgi:predicted ester cyclase
MSTEENKALARRAYDALNQRNWSVDGASHNASMTIQGLEAYKQFLSVYLTAFPDAQLTSEDMIAVGDKVVIRQTFRGTHQGQCCGVPRSQKTEHICAC